MVTFFSASTWVQDEYVVVSVGPYRLLTRLRFPRCHNWLTNSSFSASPARLMVTTPSGSGPCSINWAAAEGTVLSKRARLVTFPPCRLSHHLRTSPASPPVPPQLKVAHNS